MKIREYLKQNKTWFILATYVFLLAIIVYKFDQIVSYLQQIQVLLLPVIYGIVIAYIINIPMTKIENILNKYINKKSILSKFTRTISMLISMLILALILFFIAFAILPELIRSAANIIINLTNFINSAINNTDQLLSIVHIDVESVDNVKIEKIMSDIGLNYRNLINQATTWIALIGNNIFGILSFFADKLSKWLIGFMISIYFLSSKETFIRQLRVIAASIYPKEKLNSLFETSHQCNVIFKKFVGGQLVECFILGFLIYLALSIFGIPFSLLIATITALCALIPIFGAIISWIIGFLLILSIDPIKAVIFLFVYQGVQQIENNLIYPKVVGESVGLPAFWTLLSIIIFGGLYGISGMIIAVPFTACLYVIVKNKISEHLEKRNIEIKNNEYTIDKTTYKFKK